MDGQGDLSLSGDMPSCTLRCALAQFDVEFHCHYRYDHLKKEATDYQPASIDKIGESWRSAVESALTRYHKDYYKTGYSSTYATSAAGNITIIACIESHQFQPKNFWLVCQNVSFTLFRPMEFSIKLQTIKSQWSIHIIIILT